MIAKLQYALNLLSEWAQIWQLSVSIYKCCILTVCSKPLSAPVDFSIGGNVLSHVSSCRDLGVVVSHDLKPTNHIGDDCKGPSTCQCNFAQLCVSRH